MEKEEKCTGGEGERKLFFQEQGKRSAALTTVNCHRSPFVKLYKVAELLQCSRKKAKLKWKKKIMSPRGGEGGP